MVLIMSTTKLGVINSVYTIYAHKIILGESSPLKNWIAADRSLLQEESPRDQEKRELWGQE